MIIGITSRIPKLDMTSMIYYIEDSSDFINLSSKVLPNANLKFNLFENKAYDHFSQKTMFTKSYYLKEIRLSSPDVFQEEDSHILFFEFY